MGFPTRYFLRDISDCGKSYTRSATFILGGALELRLCGGAIRAAPGASAQRAADATTAAAAQRISIASTASAR